MPRRFLYLLLRLNRSLLLWALLVGVLVAGWCFLNREEIAAFLDEYGERNELRSEVERLEKDARRLQHESEVLGEQGFEGEKAAREALRLIKPGEQVLYVEPEGSGEALQPALPDLSQDAPSSPR